ncbi:MAG: TonB-dependent receptor [Salinivirgaceae bacterium]|jgi:TonB-linked SusC/RagA family outer membrane protein|nr:TonB-dependent receptor [Salinivirgaceae bacterium]
MGKKIIMLILLLGTLTLAHGQKRKITGTVTDKITNETLPGVSVIVKADPSKGTVTNIDGAYTIEVDENASFLVFSFIGMNKVERAIGESNTIDVELEPTTSQLDEVVVVGYGTESKKLLTSSISDVSLKDIEKTPTSNVDEALQGKTAGVNISSNSGTPGGGISVRIRGMSSISGGSTPLYVVDGIPIITGDLGQVSYSGQNIDAISNLNPNDIESISILKDASSAAIYGARGTNGVVLITTKKGKSGKTIINASVSMGVEQMWNKPDLINSEEWLAYQNDLNGTDINPAMDTVNTDWIDEVTQLAPVANYEISAAGGDSKTKYYMSGSYFTQEGILKSTSFDRLSGRLNLDHRPNRKVHFGAKLSISGSENNRVEGDQSLHAPLAVAMSLPSTYPVYNSTGAYDQSGPYANPMAIINEATNTANAFSNINNAFFNYEILNGLTFDTRWGLDYYMLNEHSFDPPTTRQGAQTNGMGFETFNRSTNFTSNNTFNYIQSVGENAATGKSDLHNFNLLAGYSFEKYKRSSSFIQGVEFPHEDLQYVGSAATIQDASASSVETGTNSFFYRGKYNYKYKYLVNFTGRYDGSSRFGANNQYGFFPGASAAWRISEEAFMKSIDLISDLKLKGGFGVTGNDNIGNFRAIALYTSSNYAGAAGIIPLQIPNEDLKWETTYQSDIGLTAGILKDRITVNMSYYYKRTTDLLLDRPIPGSSGFTIYADNIGEMLNKGVELTLNASVIPNVWTLNFNIAHNKNKVTKLYNGIPIENIGRGNQRIAEGEPISHFYGYNALGVDPSTGYMVFEDINNDGSITEADRTIIGDPHPDFAGGLTNTFSYKNFELNILFQYSYGNDIFNATRIYTESLGITGDNQSTNILDRWQTPGDITDVPLATSTPNPVTKLYNNVGSSRFIEDGSYIRLKNLSLAYNVDQKVLDKLKLNSLKVYFSAKNLFTFTNYSGLDPEVNYAGNDNVVMGVEFFTYPSVRTFTFGINIGI